MINQNILQYESKVWATADLLIGAGIKQSDFPKFMMPFFALILVESRILKSIKDVKVELGEDFDKKEILEEIKGKEIGYNTFIIEQDKTLKDICINDKVFELDFYTYLKGFDDETQVLLGIDKTANDVKYLDLTTLAGQLKGKSILYSFVKKWSEIDLTGFSNSEITTLEEHIKRKWADISADTAGEQFTPDDVIFLMADIIASMINPEKQDIIKIYDPTCGGGNLLFGVEDRLKESHPDVFTQTYGQDWNGSLYALAKIESRFRADSHITYGNTLTDDKHHDLEANIIVGNPPYGIPWGEFQKNIVNDKSEPKRFHYLPSVSDGQLLFLQQLVSKMSTDGISMGIVVHNGSSLFSGDAGSGESNIRKWLFDKDIVEAIVQLPTDEFFNTGIYTYLWILNHHKPAQRKDKVMLLNASEKFKPLKKSKGSKRKEVAEENRLEIVETLLKFQDTDFAKVYDKSFFYFNKQAIMLTNVDENGKSLEDILPVKKGKEGEEIRAKSISLTPIKITQVFENETIEIKDFQITTFDATKYKSLLDYYEKGVSLTVQSLDYKQNLTVRTAEATYHYDSDKETIVKTILSENKSVSMVNEKLPHYSTSAVTSPTTINDLGCGKIVIKSSHKKASKTKPEMIEISVDLMPDYQKDYEIIPYNPDPQKNQRQIDDFMEKYVSKPFVYLDNTVGVEINFNKVFYKPEALRPITFIMSELEVLENELANLENELAL
jgi:type I restriction enzyme M protein